MLKSKLNSFIGRQMSGFRPMVNRVTWKVQGLSGLQQNKNKVIQKTSHTGHMI